MKSTLNTAVAATALVAALAIGSTATAQRLNAGSMTWTSPNGYIYNANSYYLNPPYYPSYYGYGGSFGRGYYGRSGPLPPYGFGSRHYNGYNDPYYGSYGPGVREFLRFGGADFYGW